MTGRLLRVLPISTRDAKVPTPSIGRGDLEVRFSLFKFKLPKKPRPAWDSQDVIRRIEEGREYRFRGRLGGRKFASPEDCRKEDESWAASLGR